MSFSKRVAGLFAAAILSIAPALAAPVDHERLDQRLNKLMKTDAMVGLAVAVIEDGEITFAQGYGVTHYGGSAVSTDTVFRWASLSKGVASTAAVKLASENKLSLTDKLSSFATTIRLPGQGERRGTIENVLSHMVGIVPNAYDLKLEDGGNPAEIRRSLGKLKAKGREGGFDKRVAINESGVCEGRPPGQTEMRLMSQCLRELGFAQDRNATRDTGLGRSRKWRLIDTSGTSITATSVPSQSSAKTVI